MSGAQLSNIEVGTEAGGFRITNNAQAGWTIAVWGYWTAEIVSAFAKDALGVSNKLTATSSFTLDASALKPQGIDGQEALRALFRALEPRTFVKGTVIANNALTRMQLTRLVREAGMDARLSFPGS